MNIELFNEMGKEFKWLFADKDRVIYEKRQYDIIIFKNYLSLADRLVNKTYNSVSIRILQFRVRISSSVLCRFPILNCLHGTTIDTSKTLGTSFTPNRFWLQCDAMHWAFTFT